MFTNEKGTSSPAVIPAGYAVAFSSNDKAPNAAAEISFAEAWYNSLGTNLSSEVDTTKFPPTVLRVAQVDIVVPDAIVDSPAVFVTVGQLIDQSANERSKQLTVDEENARNWAVIGAAVVVLGVAGVFAYKKWKK